VTHARSVSERIREVFRPYAANWSGVLGRGDVLIPQREISQVIDEIVDAVRGDLVRHREATDGELFEALMESRRAGSVQDQMELLRGRFRILCR
jgi:hypothetical protein